MAELKKTKRATLKPLEGKKLFRKKVIKHDDVIAQEIERHRARGVSGCVPTHEQIRAVRIKAGLNQGEAAALVFTGQTRWSDYENGKVRMHPSMWELFVIKSFLYGKSDA